MVYICCVTETGSVCATSKKKKKPRKNRKKKVCTWFLSHPHSRRRHKVHAAFNINLHCLYVCTYVGKKKKEHKCEGSCLNSTAEPSTIQQASYEEGLSFLMQRRTLLTQTKTLSHIGYDFRFCFFFLIGDMTRKVQLRHRVQGTVATRNMQMKCNTGWEPVNEFSSWLRGENKTVTRRQLHAGINLLMQVRGSWPFICPLIMFPYKCCTYSALSLSFTNFVECLTNSNL